MSGALVWAPDQSVGRGDSAPRPAEATTVESRLDGPPTPPGDLDRFQDDRAGGSPPRGVSLAPVSLTERQRILDRLGCSQHQIALDTIALWRRARMNPPYDPPLSDEQMQITLIASMFERQAAHHHARAVARPVGPDLPPAPASLYPEGPGQSSGRGGGGASTGVCSFLSGAGIWL